MITKMESDNVAMELIKPELYAVVPKVSLTINGTVVAMSINDLGELRKITDNMWHINDLYQYTTESIQERKSWEDKGLTPTETMPMKVGRY